MGFFGEVLSAIFGGSGFAALPNDWRQVIMIAIACLLLYMGIGKKFEPLLLVPIAFGMLLANLPLTGLLNEPSGSSVGFMWVLYQGVNYAIYPSIIFMGIIRHTHRKRNKDRHMAASTDRLAFSEQEVHGNALLSWYADMTDG